MTPRGLNPTNCSEGGDPLHSTWGRKLEKIRLQGPITILSHKNLMYAAPYGIARGPITIRASLPYVRAIWPGPLPLDSQYAPKAVR